MPELRDDPLTGSTVIVAPGRGARPSSHRADRATVARTADCPFCEGNESQTPPETHRRGGGRANGPGWTVRVVPNLFPIVDGEAGEGPGRSASGRHEVVVLSPAHDRALGDLSEQEIAVVFDVWRARCAAHLRAGARHVSAFVNHGRAAGGSIEHPHAQLVALDFTPPAVDAALERFGAAGRDLVADEIEDAARRGLEIADGEAPTWCPWAASAPYEIVAAHRSKRGRFDEARDDEISAVAASVRDALRRLASVLGDAPYNLVLHSAPTAAAVDYHWHVRISPRLTVAAGFELGTGLSVNVVAPEQAAQRLREATA